MTKREGILQAAVDALTSVTGIVDASVYRSRVEAFSRASFPALVVEPTSDQPDLQTNSRLVWNLTFQVAACFRDDDKDTAADATVQSVHSKIMSNSALRALGDTLPGSVDWQFVQADVPLTVVTMQFKVLYQTDFYDLSV